MNDFSEQVFDRKYPISKNNKQCIGPCYEPGTWIIHPITLEYVTNTNHSFCPVNQWEITDPKSGKKFNRTTDECYVPTHEKDISKKEIEMNILIPKIDFSCIQFLKIYYDIHSFEDSLTWISINYNIPIFTKLRVMNCSLEAFGSNIDIIDDRLVDFYIEVIKKVWIKDIYPYIKNYIFVDNNKIYLKDNKNNELIDDKYVIEKINFFLEKFANKNMIYKFLLKYINKYKHSWNNIESHNNELKKYYKKYIIDKIIETVK